MSEQHVSVPRELLERIVAVYASSPWPSWYELRAALEAAPAEDVRAVGEEPNPFGYWRVPKGAPLQGAFLLWESDGPYGNSDSHIAGAIDAGFSVTKLYSRPQRPVVLPERKTQRNAAPYGTYDYGWNACIDEFERLNK